MTCKCSPDNLTTRDRAAVCCACIWGQHEDRQTVACTISGEPVAEHLGWKPCPLDKHGPRRKTVRWLGLVWYGVPYPIRVWLWVTNEKHPKPSSFTGCGCIKALKDRILRLLGKGADHAHPVHSNVIGGGRLPEAQ